MERLQSTRTDKSCGPFSSLVMCLLYCKFGVGAGVLFIWISAWRTLDWMTFLYVKMRGTEALGHVRLENGRT